MSSYVLKTERVKKILGGITMIYISDDECRQMNENHEKGKREELELEVEKVKKRVSKLEKQLKVLTESIKGGNK